MKQKRKVLKIIANVLVWIFVVFAVMMTALALAAQSNPDGVPAIGGKCFLTVASDSMSPTFEKGDLIVANLILEKDKGSLQVGDIVSFYADLDGNGSMEINTHRIVAVNTTEGGTVVSYVTKGDKANAPVDTSPVSVNRVLCKWSETDDLRVVGVGGFIGFLQKPTGFLLLIVLPLVALFVYQLVVFIRTLLSVKNKGKKTITAEDEELIKQRAIEEYLRQQQEQAAQDSQDAQDTQDAPKAE